jgi:SAM-dependent methyltransferase
MDWYKNWFGSPFYKILYQNRDELEAREFIENLLRYLQPTPGSKMLDIACGEGRFARQLAEHGFDVTGIDISNENIEAANTDQADNLHFFVHDMRMPFYINYFDYAFNFFTSFGYFTHNRDHALAAKSFAAGLKEDGLLVVDYLNYEYVTANFVYGETVKRGGHTFHIRRRMDGNHIVKEIEFTDDENQDRVYTESVAAFTLADFIKMFGNAGMSLVATYGDYRLQPYHPVDSPRLIMVFKKKHA